MGSSPTGVEVFGVPELLWLKLIRQNVTQSHRRRGYSRYIYPLRLRCADLFIRTSSIFVSKVWKAPDISQSNSVPERHSDIKVGWRAKEHARPPLPPTQRHRNPWCGFLWSQHMYGALQRPDINVLFNVNSTKKCLAKNLNLKVSWMQWQCATTTLLRSPTVCDWAYPTHVRINSSWLLHCPRSSVSSAPAACSTLTPLFLALAWNYYDLIIQQYREFRRREKGSLHHSRPTYFRNAKINKKSKGAGKKIGREDTAIWLDMVVSTAIFVV